MSTSKDLAAVKAHVEAMIRYAAERGIVVTVEQVPLTPLAMGNYRTDVSVRSSSRPVVIPCACVPGTSCKVMVGKLACEASK